MEKKIFLGFSLLMATVVAFGQVKMEKDYDESFPVESGNKVEISNKYGEVIIRSSSDNQVRVVAKVTARGRNQEVVNKTMRRVRFDMRKVGQMITVSTDIEKRGGTFTEFFQGVEDYSKTLFGNNQKLTVNVEVWMPENIDLTISNRYGDIYLTSLTGDLDITLAHGDIRGDRLEGRVALPAAQ